MPNGDENELIIGDTRFCLDFPDQRYLLQVGGAQKGLGQYNTFPDALAGATAARKGAPNIFIRIFGDSDKRTYFLIPGELTP